jgi:hypothetical protein
MCQDEGGYSYGGANPFSGTLSQQIYICRLLNDIWSMIARMKNLFHFVF